MLGAIFAAAAAWIVLGDGFGGDRILSGGTWRHYALLAALPAATALFLSILFVPESPRYLATTGVWYCCCRFGSKAVLYARWPNLHGRCMHDSRVFALDLTRCDDHRRAGTKTTAKKRAPRAPDRVRVQVALGGGIGTLQKPQCFVPGQPGLG